jgi:hypothetical protein
MPGERHRAAIGDIRLSINALEANLRVAERDSDGNEIARIAREIEDRKQSVLVLTLDAASRRD